MRAEIEKRLQSLTAEFKTGHEMLTELDGRRANLQATLTRISGAIQVLQELLQSDQAGTKETEADSTLRTGIAA
jgi:septation ring formation regulator EzrA